MGKEYGLFFKENHLEFILEMILILIAAFIVSYIPDSIKSGNYMKVLFYFILFMIPYCILLHYRFKKWKRQREKEELQNDINRDNYMKG